MNKPIIAITMGDSNGIGPESVIKVLSDEDVYGYCRPFLVADPSALTPMDLSRWIDFKIDQRVMEPSYSLTPRGRLSSR